MMWTSGMGAGMWLLMAAGTFGFWFLIAMLVRAILSDRLPGPGAAGRGVVPSALHLLGDRLARGEITLEEYEQRRRALTGLATYPDQPASSISSATSSATAAGPQSPLAAPDPTKDRHRSS
ncbi:SHOCT domain-containing protein [Terrabacter sp. NPDC000476]|uniref:SHOCT domain-containing protein n=1 Tax=Terrabacter sp. NPDC000476 TaxID=3154258 RepID=UPI00331E2895